MSPPRVVVLGGGPAGVGGAYRLRALDRASVTVVEQRERVGGNAGSFRLWGQPVDYGSHRLHPACDAEILSDIRGLLGDRLVKRPRHGRIRLRGRWIHFPLRPLDLLLRLDPAFAAGAARDALRGLIPSVGGTPENTGGQTFASVLEEALGPTVCHSFYFPYARKVWGREPEELSGVQARRRVSANSVGKLLRKVAGKLPGVKPAGFTHFYYPRGGYGSISEAYAREARDLGADFLLGWRAERVEHIDPGGAPEAPRWRVVASRDGEERELVADYVWSTVPISVLARIVARPPVPDAVIQAARQIRYRGMLLIYIRLGEDRFSEYDAHYFPEVQTSITRLSEPKNYAGTGDPEGRTVLCAELPADRGDGVWEQGEAELAELVARDLRTAGIPLPSDPVSVHVERLGHAYPIYLKGYERPFRQLDSWAGGLPGILTYGRQGLFAHDNTHHALAMAYAAADCLEEGRFDASRWEDYRREFEEHVVED